MMTARAHFVARHLPHVLEDDDTRVFFVSGHSIDAKWLKARWPVMAATDLYERARRARDADIGFLLLMMSLEVLFIDGRSELSRRLAQRCAFLNGRDSGERKAMSYTYEDDRLAYREQRFVTLDLLREVVVSIVHTEEGDHVHVISMRKAAKREREIYFQSIAN